MKNKSLVLGKLLDFHIGHEALIRFAQSKAKSTIVLLCKSDLDRRPVAQREDWIKKTFGNTIELVIVDQEKEGLEQKEESDRGVSEQWAKWVDEKFPEVDLLVGSEDYVRYMADYGDFDFELFDIDREEFPCSSTSVNAGAYEFRSEAAKFDLSKPVVFLGPESTGKTTAVHLLGGDLGVDMVFEAARKLVSPDGTFTWQDLDRFALQQRLDIDLAIRDSKSEIVLIDSSAFTTAAYSVQQFGDISDTVSALIALETAQRYNYLIFAPDVPIIDDGTRHSTDHERQVFYAQTIDWMERLGLPYRVVNGKDYAARIEFAKNIILTGDYENA